MIWKKYYYPFTFIFIFNSLIFFKQIKNQSINQFNIQYDLFMHPNQQNLLFHNQNQNQTKNNINMHTIDQSFNSIQINNQSKDNQQKAISFLSNYLLLDQQFPLTLLKNSSNLRTKHYKEATYYGEIKNGKKHGWGIMNYHCEKIYEGSWKQDKKNGYGVQKLYNESFYKGNYQNGKPQGYGQFIWDNGQKYQGSWHKGLKHGSGTWIGIKGDSYKGQWKEGNPDGFGIYMNQSGDIYEGQFKQCLKHGKGIQKFSNGDMYRGYYQNGKPSGEGAYFWENGSYFKGAFLNGLRNGKGIWKRGPGKSDKYEGEYKNDKKCGYGQFQWVSGNIYKGNYEGDVRNGYGQMSWVNGSIYKGEWSNGIQHGIGQIFIPDQGLKKGRFQNNVIIQVYYEDLNSQKGSTKLQRKKITSKSLGKNNTIKNQFLIKSNNKQKAKARYPSNKHEINAKKEKEVAAKQISKEQFDKMRANDKLEESKRQKSQKILAFLNDHDESNEINQKNYIMNSSIRHKYQSKTPNNRTESRDKRLLHSSFYLYKLNQRHNKNVKQTNRSISSIIPLSKKIPMNYRSEHATIKH